MAALPEDERAALLRDIGDLLARHGVERFALQAENEVYVARRRS